jgi:glycosyltransferase involved in cell wall biosynthesis
VSAESAASGAVRRSIACVIPTHGRPDQLERSLASVLAQTRLPDEVIVVDDLAHPPTAALVVRIAEQHRSVRVQYLQVADRAGRPGASRSRNAGAASSASDIVGFLDDDDEWLPEFLHATETMMASGGYDAVAAWMRKRRNETEIDGPLLPRDVIAAEVLANNPGFTGSTFVISRHAYDVLGGFDEQLPVSNDKDFLYRLLSGGFRLGVVEQRLVLRHLESADRLSIGGMSRAAALAVYVRKYADVLTKADRRQLERDILMNLRGDTPSKLARAGLLAAAAVRTGRTDLRRLSGRRRLGQARAHRSG